MIKQIKFTKMVASGNDFIIIDERNRARILRLQSFALEVCNRQYGAGADGLLILDKSKKADIRLRIFNPDGSEPKMCGNGIRCVALYAHKNKISIQTKAGVINAKVNKTKVKVNMPEPKHIKLDLPIKINKQNLKVNFINTGVPHVVIFVEGLNRINVVNIGRQVRFHRYFAPKGTNVDFVQIQDDNNIKLRTYERGVEDETRACGTGAVAAALLSARSRINPHTFWISEGQRLRKGAGVNVHTESGGILRVEFDKQDAKFKDVWLEGKVRVVYSGVYYV